MRAILCNLLAAMLLVHALVGCCHCHSDAVSQSEIASIEQVAAKCGCGHCHEETESESSHDSSPCDCKVECKALCIYVPTSKCVVDAGQMMLSLENVLAISAVEVTALLQMASASSCNLEMRGNPAQWPPMRLHLLHQIILI